MVHAGFQQTFLTMRDAIKTLVNIVGYASIVFCGALLLDDGLKNENVRVVRRESGHLTHTDFHHSSFIIHYTSL